MQEGYHDVIIQKAITGGQRIEVGAADADEGARPLFVDRISFTGASAPEPAGAPSDADSDGVPDSADNCSEISNPDQTLDRDADGKGDTCDGDIDGDSRPNDTDYDRWDPTVQHAPPSSSECDVPLQTQIEDASPGDTIGIAGCTFREEVTVGKPITIVGGGTATIKGSEVYTGFSESSAGENFVSEQKVPTFSYTGGQNDCADGVTSCLWEEQVFVNGEEQTQIAGGVDPEEGEFRLDSSRHVVLGSDPAGKSVEVSTREKWLTATVPGVTVQGVDFTHLSNAPQKGGVIGNDNFTIRGGTISRTHGAGVDLGTDARAEGVLVEGTRFLHTGHMGIKGTEIDAVVRGIYCHDVNNQMFRPSWASGCLKNTHVKSLLVENSVVEGAYGHGFWCDACNDHESPDQLIYRNNRTSGTTRAGIDVEVSRYGRITGNVISDAGYGDASGWWGAGILSNTSSDLEISDNVVYDCADGISVLYATRPQIPVTKNMDIRGNIVIAKRLPDSGGNYLIGYFDTSSAGSTLWDSANNNHGNGGAYYHPLSEAERRWILRFAWNGGLFSLQAFNTTPGEESGRYLSESERDAILADNNLPTY